MQQNVKLIIILNNSPETGKQASNLHVIFIVQLELKKYLQDRGSNCKMMMKTSFHSGD